MDIVSSSADFAPVARNPEGHIGAAQSRIDLESSVAHISEPGRFAGSWSIIVDLHPPDHRAEEQADRPSCWFVCGDIPEPLCTLRFVGNSPTETPGQTGRHWTLTIDSRNAETTAHDHIHDDPRPSCPRAVLPAL
jgi:hypothetical protein